MSRSGTCETGKVRLQVRGADLVLQDVRLVEEEDDGGVIEPRRVDGGGEEGQALLHAVLRLGTERWAAEVNDLRWREKKNDRGR